MTEPAPVEFNTELPVVPIGASLEPNTIRFLSQSCNEVARIGSDGIMRFTVDPNDENAAQFINCIETFLSTRINGIVVKGHSPVDFMDECRMIAAQCWCAESTKHLVMIPELAEAFARVLCTWMDVAAQHCRNEAFYRGLLDKCAAELGPVRPKVFVQDDGGIVIDPLRIKIPELVKELATAATSWMMLKQNIVPESELGEEIIVPGHTVHDGKIVY